MGRIVHISDLHFSRVEVGLAESALEAIARIDPDVVVVSGDLTLRGRAREFREAATFLEKIEAPVLCVPGNHDYPGHNLLRRFVMPLALYRRHVARDVEPEMLVDGMFLLGVNTARRWGPSLNWALGRFSLFQIARVELAMRERKDDRLRCLVAHHPMFVERDARGFRPAGRADLMKRTLARGRVDLVLSGHLHLESCFVERVGEDGDSAHSTVFVHAGTLTSTRTRGEANSFACIEVGEETMSVSMWAYDGVEFTGGEERRFVRGDVGWSELGIGG